MPAQSKVDAGIWTVPGQPLRVEYSRAVLNDILLHAVEAYDSYVAGGYEVGGVLFGYQDGFHVRIDAFRAIEIQPPRPSFVLSEKDEANLAEMLKAARTDASLAGMQAVGWYHSHTRSEIFLSEADLEIYDRNFPEPYQVAMVLHPSEHEPVRVGFFFRESDGFIRADQSYQEFAVDVPPRNPSYRKQPPWKINVHGEPEEPPLSPLAPVEPEEYALAPEAEKPRAGQRLATWGLLVAAAVTIFASVHTIAGYRDKETGLGLKVTAAGGELVVQWDPTNRAITSADHLELILKDGSKQLTIPVEHRKLKEPVFVYRPTSSRVDVKLRAAPGWFGTSPQESTTFLGPGLNITPPELAEARIEVARTEEATKQLRSTLDEELERVRELESQIEEINQRKIDEHKRIEAKKKEQAARRVTEFRPPPARPAVVTRDLPDAPNMAPRATVGASPSPPAMTFPTRAAEPPPPPPRPVPVAPSVAASIPPVTPSAVTRTAPPTPTAGRIIWTGELAREASLTIDGRKASKGSLNGELPGGAVRVGAYPAELTSDGLRILTGNPRYAQPRVEQPSAANGWQKTQYVYDPKAVRDLIVEQMPAKSNPKQLILRGGSRKISVIVIEWQLSTP